jgi:hypothetical protein
MISGISISRSRIPKINVCLEFGNTRFRLTNIRLSCTSFITLSLMTNVRHVNEE